MASEFTYQKIRWNGTEMTCVEPKVPKIETPGGNDLSVRADMQYLQYNKPAKKLLQDITDCAGREINNLSIVNHSGFSDESECEINISHLNLKSFSLVESGSKANSQVASVCLDQPSDTLLYFSLVNTLATQELLDVVSACPNLLGLAIDTYDVSRGRLRNLARTIPIPANKDIKYWMFNLGSVDVSNWEAHSLEIIRLDSAGLEQLPSVLLHPPDSLDEAYLSDNKLDNSAVMPLHKMLSGENNKTISLSKNHDIIDIPTWDGVRIKETTYYADNIFFRTPDETKNYCPYLYGEDRIISELESEIIEGGSEFVIPRYNDRVKQVGKENGSKHKDIYLHDIEFMTHDFKNLFGYSEKKPDYDHAILCINEYKY